jgi:alkanesulfonate monooxygenase SsuD/methylene tetrahydromethanopterin reductase-like flavin-dependent oxidoreductase (luciferase family)
MSPASATARLAGERGWGMVSANFMPVIHAKSHWKAYCEGAASAGRLADRANWRLARSIICTETDAEARDYLANESCSPGWYYAYIRDSLASHNLLKIFKPTETMPDSDLTVPRCLELMVISGSPSTVLDRLVELIDEVGYFGALLVTQKDWDNPGLHRNSLRLIAEQVMPKFSQHAQSMHFAG